jgi:sigma-B regulation protein RsbU (phosphoserine phosphatase)
MPDGTLIYVAHKFDGSFIANSSNEFPKREQYGLEPMCEIISQNWHLSAQQIKQAVIDDVRQYIGTQKVFDDITLLVLKRTEVSVETELQFQAAVLV